LGLLWGCPEKRRFEWIRQLILQFLFRSSLHFWEIYRVVYQNGEKGADSAYPGIEGFKLGITLDTEFKVN
jgi:hypothetical protein